MPVLDPDRIPVVALAAMNQVHQEEAELINSLSERLRACAEGRRAPADLDAPLDQLLEHLQAHFASEEARMRSAGFPPYPVHKAEHDRVLAEARAMVAHWRESRGLDELQAWLEQALPAWMLRHIATMDTVTAQFLQAQDPAQRRA